MERPAGGRLVDRAHELAMLCGSTLLVPFGDRTLQALCQGLDRRAVAEVLEPLPSRGSHTFLLLLDVGHDVKNARSAGRAIVAKRWLRARCLAGAPGTRPPRRGRQAGARIVARSAQTGRTLARISTVGSTAEGGGKQPHPRAGAGPGSPRRECAGAQKPR